MDHAVAMPFDEALALVETLQDVERKEISQSTVFYGKDAENFSYFIILPPIGEAIVLKHIANLLPMNVAVA